MTNTADAILEQVYVADGTGAALDVVYEWFDDQLRSGCLSRCEDAMRAVDLERVNGAVMLGFLCVTAPAREILAGREDLVRRVEARLREVAPDRAEYLLEGLR